MFSSRRTKVLFLVLACAVLLFALTYAVWFRWMGEYLVHTDPVFKAQAVVVLGGDWTGDRILKAAELVKEGYAPVVLVSGPMAVYGVNEAELAIDYAARAGYPKEFFVPVMTRAFSTREEAAFFGPDLRRRGISRVLIVTSDFHTHRAGEIFRKALGPEFEVRIIAAPDRHFTPSGWWKDREGRKTFFYEWSKTIGSPLGL